MSLDALSSTSGNTSRVRFSLTRESRVVILLACIVLMSLADLDMTLTYTRTVGMAESNPIARAIMGTQSISAIVCFKTLTSAIGIGVLFRLRQRRSAEVGAWILMAIMGWLMVHWGAYNAGIPELYGLTASIPGNGGDPSWVSIPN